MKRVLSLFSGCGGMDLGFEGGFTAHKKSVNQMYHKDYILDEVDDNFVKLKHTSFETVFANDILDYAQSCWINYFSKRKENANNIFIRDSIVHLLNQYYNGDFEFPQNIDVVTGGFPCQDFSVAGKRNGFNSHRNHLGELLTENETSRGQLYLLMREVISITKPKIFIAENVKGLVSLGDVKKIIQDDLRDIDQGYLVLDAQVLNAKNYGVAQNRERVIFIGISRRYAKESIMRDLEYNAASSILNPYPPITHGVGDTRYVTLKDILFDLPEPDGSNDPSHKSYSKAKYYGRVQGGTEINMNGQAPTIRAEHHGNIEFRRLSEEHGGKNYKELKDGFCERRLSVRECARIQSFPDEYEFVFNYDKLKINASQGYKVVGNAVPPLLAFAIATHLERIWERLFT